MRPMSPMNELIARRAGETDLQYQKRLVYGKLVDKTLADVDYSELSEPLYGQRLASDECRKRMYGSRRTLEVISESEIRADTPEDMACKITELKVERQKLFDERVALNKSIRAVARQQELTEIIERVVSSGSLPNIVVREKVRTRSDAERDLLVSLNDIHFGAVVDNAWRKYDSDICSDVILRGAS